MRRILVWATMIGLQATALPMARAAVSDVSFEDRVRYQERLERIRHLRRGGDPARFSELMPPEALEARVRRYLLQSSMVDAYSTRLSLTDAKLQAELERICRTTRAPQALKALLAALDNNAYLAREILVRPILAERMTRSLYASDASFHHDERLRAEALLSRLQASGGRDMPALADGEAVLFGTVVLQSPGQTHRVGVELDEVTLARRHAELTRTPEAPRLRTTSEAYVIERLVRRNGREPGAGEAEPLRSLEIESLSVPRRPYEAWLEQRATSTSAPGPVDEAPSVDGATIRFEPVPPVDAFGPTCADDSWKETLADIPEARFGAQAIWTGTEMIVWGGVPGAGTINSGGRYDPALDSWVATSTVGAPTGRTDFTLVWTGTEMIVWGGSSGPTRVDTGGRYDPTTDSWTPTSTTGAPQGRYYHSSVWTGTEMIVWGGGDQSGTPLDTGGRYDPSTDTWTPTTITAAPMPRSQHQAVWTGSAMIVWGGFESNYVNTGGIYDPVLDQWTPTDTTTAPAGRTNFTAIWSGSEMIVFGGFGNSGAQYAAYRYDPVGDGWTAFSPPIAARYGHTAVWTGTEMIVWGGTPGGPYFNDGAIYDPVGDSWQPTTLTGAPSGRYAAVAVWADDQMVVWGGLDGSPLDTGGRYDPVANSWLPTSVTGAPSGRGDHTAIWTGAEMVVWGGTDGTPLGDGSAYEPATNIWRVLNASGAPAARSGHTAVWTGGRMVVWGGTDGTPLGNGRRYTVSTDSWAAVTNSGAPAARTDATAVWTGSRMLVFGGFDGTPLATGGLYDPVSNAWTTIAAAADARYDHEAVWTGTQLLVWGGTDGATPVSAGAVYDLGQDAWGPISAASAPAATFQTTAVWTGDTMIVWGGDTGVGLVNTGGRYDPVSDTWLPTTTTGAPSSRSGHVGVWTGTDMLVWGGASSLYLGSGRRYDPVGDTWSAVSSFRAPSGRRGATSVWTGTEMIVWGGTDGGYLKDGGIYTPDCECTDPWEPNESLATAASISPATLHDALVCTASDLDYFELDVPSGGTLDLTMEPPVGWNYDLFLYDGAGNLLAASTSAGDATEALSWTTTAAGTLYALVRGHDGTQWSDSQFYTLYYLFDPCPTVALPVYIPMVTLDANNHPVLHIQDPNDPIATGVTGYNIYRDVVPNPPSWTLIAGNVVDMDAGTPNVQFVDQTATGGSYYYKVTPYNATCGSEGPIN